MEVVKILFSPKGPLNAKEFRIGLYTIIFYFLMIVSMRSMSLIENSILSKLSVSLLSENAKISSLTQSFLPSIAPFGVVLSFSSFIIAYKRAYVLLGNAFLSIISGLINYLFFGLILFSLMYWSITKNGMMSLPNWFGGIKLTLIIIGIILGLIQLIWFTIKHKEDDHNLSNSLLNSYIFTSKIWTIIWVSTISYLLWYVVALSLKSSAMTPILFIVISLLLILTFTILYWIQYCKHLIKNGLSVLWILVPLFIFILTTILLIIVMKNNSTFMIESLFIWKFSLAIYFGSQALLVFVTPKES